MIYKTTSNQKELLISLPETGTSNGTFIKQLNYGRY